ncbi:MAG: hypothetical protein ACSHX0_10685 [Akkermansiaceae bacterium]
MARKSRSKSSTSTTTYIIIGIVAIAALVLGKSFLDKQASHFTGLSELSIGDIKSNANSLSGNEYKVSGKISEKLKWTAEQGQVISLAVENEGKESGVIPIIVPASLDKTNLERGHRYIFKVDINREGLPVALDVKAL